MGLEKILAKGIIMGSLFLNSCVVTQVYAQQGNFPKREAKQEASFEELSLKQKVSIIEEKIKSDTTTPENHYELGQVFFDEATKFYESIKDTKKLKWFDESKMEDSEKNDEDYKNWKTIRSEGDTAFNKGIELDMKKETVEDILKGANVEFVKYDSKTKKTNYDELVYQKNLKPEEKKPVLVMFYHNKDPPTAEVKGTAHRDAIIFKNLSKKYSGQINFLQYNVDINPELAKDNYTGFRRDYDVRSIPSIIMYAPFDLLKGETPKKNDGKIKQIDVLRGGPVETGRICAWLKNGGNWIKVNIREPNGEYVYRNQNADPSSQMWTKFVYKR